MTRSVTFNGRTIFHPGGITRIRTNGSASVGPTATGIVGLIGEATSGTPGVITTIDDPALAAEIFGTGPLADAIRTAFEPSNDPRMPSGAFRVLCYKTNQSTKSSVNIPGARHLISDTSTGASTTTVITVTVGGLVVNAHIGRWLKSASEIRKIVSNTANTVTVSPAFSAAPVNTDPVFIQEDVLGATSVAYGADTTQIAFEFEAGVGTGKYVVTISKGSFVEQSAEILGNPALKLKFIGGPTATNGTGSITAATINTVSFTSAGTPALNAFANMVVHLPNGLQRLVASNTNAGAPCVLTLTAGYELTVAEAAAIVGGTATVKNVTAATANITGANGVATGLTSSTTQNPVSGADDLSLSFAVNETLNQFITRINNTTNYIASLGNGFNGDTVQMKTSDFGTRANAVDVRFDDEILIATKGSFRRDLQDLIDYINNTSTLITVARSTTATSEGAEIPAVTGGVVATVRDFAIYLAGGTRGISANSNFQAGFDTMLLHRVNQVVPLISQDLTNEGFSSTATFASVAAQLAAFVQTAAGSGKNECGGYLGMHGTKSQLLVQAATLNSPDVSVFGQQITVLDVSGTLTKFPEWMQAVQAAGMRAGAPEVGEPLTFKTVSCTAITQDSSWDPASVTDDNALLAGGVMFAETLPNGTFRWVRDITTYITGDEEFYMAGSTRDATRFIAYDLRKKVEDKFTGLKGTPATVASVREFIANTLQNYLTSNIIVPSLDPETGTILVQGWRNLRVFLDGSVLTFRVEIFPVVGICFQLNDISLNNVRLSV